VSEEQLPDVASNAALTSQTSAAEMWTDCQSVSIANTLCFMPAQAVTVSVTCAKSVASSSVPYQQHNAASVADEQLLEGNEESCAVPDMLSTGAVKLEPKVEMETSSNDTTAPVGMSVENVKVERIKTEMVKCEIKSEAESEESGDNKAENIKNAAAIVKCADDDKSLCDVDVKRKSPSRKGLC